MKKLNLLFLVVIFCNQSCSSTKTKRDDSPPCSQPQACYTSGVEEFSKLKSAKSSHEAAEIFKEAALLFKTGCDLKDAKSCFELARYHKAQHSIGIALALFNQACELGHKKACAQVLKDKK